MKKIHIALILFLLLTLVVQSDELSNAYNKEYTFLKAQKSELKSRLNKEKRQQKIDLSKAKAKTKLLQNKYLKMNAAVKSKHTAIEKLSEKLSDKQSNSEITGSVVIQARGMLDEYGVVLDENNQTSNIQKMEKAFELAKSLYAKLSSIQLEKGKFYLPDGSIARGEIVKVGNIAAYGISSTAAGALAPAGEGHYKLWNAVGSADDAKALFAGEMLPTIDIFTYENMAKEVAYKKEKTLDDILKGGGVIGYIILVLGAFGLFLLSIRVFILLLASSNTKKISRIVAAKVENGEGDEALEAVKKFKGSAARVIRATLRNIKREREHVEDIVMENILNESGNIDRFGGFVMVLAAVAPLLGLLGTVTGMITTFDMITEYGTGDPKMLSGGISEALITTMFGLIVAIPLLMLGNLMSGWAQGIKDSMEQSALHIVNIFEKYNAK